MLPMHKNTPIIIGGSHRSGTTVVRRMLNSHPRIFCPAEIKFHKTLLRQFPKDPLEFARLGASMKALNLPEEVWLDEFGKALIRCYELAAAQEGKQRWADKNPENALNIWHWDRLLASDFHFILVVRHPLDIIASMNEVGMKRVLPPENEGKADHVRSYIETGLDYCESHPAQSMIIRYESLVTQPETTLRDMLGWLDENFTPQMLTGLGHASHRKGLEDPKVHGRDTVSAENVGRWKRDFSADEANRLFDLLEDLMLRLGYERATNT